MTQNDRLASAAHAFLSAHHAGKDVEQAARAFLDAYEGDQRAKANLVPDGCWEIMKAVARQEDTTVDRLRHRDSWPAYTKPRQKARWLMAQAGHSLSVIAAASNRDNHTTVLASIRAFEKRMERDPELAREMAPYRKLRVAGKVGWPALVAVGGGRAA